MILGLIEVILSFLIIGVIFQFSMEFAKCLEEKNEIKNDELAFFCFGRGLKIAFSFKWLKTVIEGIKN